MSLLSQRLSTDPITLGTLGASGTSGFFLGTQTEQVLLKRTYAWYDGIQLYLGNTVKWFDYNADIFVKRFRIACNLPGLIYSMTPTALPSNFDPRTGSSIGIRWSHTGEGALVNPLYTRLAVGILSVAPGEWIDINAVLPRSDNLFASLPNDPGTSNFTQTMVSLPPIKFFYRGVPAEFAGQALTIVPEFEIATSRDIMLQVGGN